MGIVYLDKMRWTGFLIAALVGVSGCGTGSQTKVKKEVLDPSQIKIVVAEVMEDQTATVSDDYGLKALDRYEDSLFRNSGEGGELQSRTIHRLADLYIKLEDRMYRQQLKRYNQKLLLLQQGKITERPSLPKINHARSRKVYEKLLGLYPDRSENDQVLYQLARVYDDDGEFEKAVDALEQLVKRYPSSPMHLESVFRLAETYYDSDQYEKAKSAYQKVVAEDETELVGQARYKLGWTHFSLQEYEDAIKTFTELVDQKRVMKGRDILRLDAQAMSATEWDEVLEVIRGIAFSFSYLGPPRKIQDYFEKAGHRDYEHLIYRKLGDQYIAQKRVQDGVKAYQAFIKAYPLHEDGPVIQMEIVRAYQRLQLIDLANKARIKFVDRFGEETPWYKNADPSSRERARPLYRELISNLAMFYHSEAQQTRRSKDYTRALKWYKRYLKSFPKEPDTARMNFLMAEGLYELKRFDQAVGEYEKTAYDYFLHHDSAEAGYAAITTLDLIITNKRLDLKTDPMAIRLAEDCKRFADAFPDDPRVGDVLWKGAETYYNADNFLAARAVAELIVKTTLPTDQAWSKAQRLIARGYFEAREYQKAAKVYKELFRSGGATGNEEEVRTLWASALYKQAEEFKAAGQLKEAQTEFLRVQEEVPGSEAAPVALYDGARVALLRNQFDEALQLFQLQIQRYPMHDLSAKVPDVLLKKQNSLLQAGKMEMAEALSEKVKTLKTASPTDLVYHSERLLADRYFEEQNYEAAAVAYKQLAGHKTAVKNKDQDELKRLWASALYKQAESLRGAGKAEEAQAGFMKIQAEIPGSDIAPVALFDAGGAALRRNDSEGALRAFSTLIREYPSSTYVIHAAIQTAKIHEQQRRLRKAAQKYEFVVKLDPDHKTGGEVLQAAARLYEQLEDWERAGSNYSLYLEKFPGEYNLVVETTFKLAWSKIQQGRRNEAQIILQELIDRFGQGNVIGTPAGYYVAKAHLLKADALMEKFDKVKLVSPLEKNLARKRDLLEKVLLEYAATTEFDVAEITTAATQKIGKVFENFGTALLDSERPQDLTPQQLEQYTFLLEEQAYPFEDKAIAAYESNVHRTHQLGVYDEWIKQSYDELARLMPAKYGKRELDEIIPPDLILTP